MVAKRPTRKKKTLTGKAGVLKLGDQVVKPLSLTEQVLNERNLSGFLESPASSSEPVFKETRHGKIRIEGKITPEKIKLAEDFDLAFQQASGEIMELASYVPNDRTMAFVKGARLSQKQINEMKDAPAWTTFQIQGETLLKTQDNKLENVKDYCFRLERAVIHQLKLKNESEAKLTTKISDLQWDIDCLERKLRYLDSGVFSTYLFEGLEFVGLQLKKLYGRVSTEVIKLLS